MDSSSSLKAIPANYATHLVCCAIPPLWTARNARISQGQAITTTIMSVWYYVQMDSGAMLRTTPASPASPNALLASKITPNLVTPAQPTMAQTITYSSARTPVLINAPMESINTCLPINARFVR